MTPWWLLVILANINGSAGHALTCGLPLTPIFLSYHITTLIMASNTAAAMDVDEAAIDEGLYSRQL